MTTKRSSAQRSGAARARPAAARQAEIKAHAQPRPSVRRLDDDPSAIIRHFVQTLERMSGRPAAEDER